MFDIKSILCAKMSFEIHCVPLPHFLVLSFLISMESFLLFSLDRFGSFKANLERSSVEISVKNNLF